MLYWWIYKKTTKNHKKVLTLEIGYGIIINVLRKHMKNKKYKLVKLKQIV